MEILASLIDALPSNLMLKCAAIVSLLFALGVGYIALCMVYNLFFHPLRSFPGPLLWRASIAPRTYYMVSGVLHHRLRELHETYGPVVRTSPNDLSFTDPDAWRDIYTRGGSNREEPVLANEYYNPEKAPNPSMFSVPKEDHDALRKLIAPSFSEKATRNQEDIVVKYVNMLMQKLQENCDSVGMASKANAVKANMKDWLAYTTFDIGGDLVFGSSFGCLQGSDYHPWVELINSTMRDMAILRGLHAFGILPPVLFLMSYFKVGDKARKLHLDFSESKMKQRRDIGNDRDDLLGKAFAADVHPETLKNNSALMVVASSETVSTLMTGALYLLGSHRDVREKLAVEIRNEFASDADINFVTTAKLPYLNAVINESLRMYPPAVATAPRRAPPEGAIIGGRAVPANALVSISQPVINRSAALFTNPDSFEPERFLTGNEEKQGGYAGDRLDAVNPFNLGSRNCLGRPMANAMMRLILAKFVWRFHFEVSEESRDWIAGQKAYMIWDKQDLNIWLKPVNR